jgi:hypothetical protein
MLIGTLLVFSLLKKHLMQCSRKTIKKEDCKAYHLSPKKQQLIAQYVNDTNLI